MLIRNACLIAIAMLFSANTRADDVAKNWHQWRGPNADGVAPYGDPPTKWDEKTNVKWKVKIPGHGSSTPIIWQDKIFLLTAIKTDKVDPKKTDPAKQPRRPFGITYPNAYYQFIVMCLDRKTGKTLWKKVAREAVPPEGRHKDNNYASASPTTDGKYLYASFGSNGIYCYDLDGNKQWERDLGDMKTRLSFGGGSSPVVHGDSLIIQWDHDGPSFIEVLNTKTGKTRWKKSRKEPSGWATPVVVEYAGKTQVITNASNKVRSYDLSNGDVLWSCGGQVANVTPSPIVKDGVAYCMSGYRGAAGYALPLDAKGDITDSAGIKWKIGADTPYIASPVLYDGLIYYTKSRSGVLSVADTKTGKVVVGRVRLPGIRGIYASSVAAAGKIYITGRGGRTVVLKHGRKFEVLAQNNLDEPTDASPAIVGNQIFIRGSKSLYCIEKQ